MDLECDVCLEPFDIYTWYEESIHKMSGCPCCKGVRPEGMSKSELLKCEAISTVLEMLGDDLDGAAAMMEDFTWAGFC